MDRSHRKRPRIDSSNSEWVLLRVTELPADASESEVRRLLSAATGLEELRLAQDWRSKGIKAFARFNNWESACRAIAFANGKNLRDKNVFVALDWSSPGIPRHKKANNSAEESRSQSHEQKIRSKLFDDSTLGQDTKQMLKLDEVAVYSTTPFTLARKQAQMMMTVFGLKPRKFRVLDGTACIGGNVVGFAEFAEHVDAIELDSVRFDMLKHNIISALKLEERVTCHQGNFMDFLRSKEASNPLLKSTHLFLDPPWGGPNYKEKQKLQLYLEKECLPSICMAIGEQFPNIEGIMLKVPNNYDFDSLCSSEIRAQFPFILWCRFFNMSLVFLKKGDTDLSTSVEMAQHLPILPEDSIFCQRFSPSTKTWKPLIPHSLLKFLSPSASSK